MEQLAGRSLELEALVGVPRVCSVLQVLVRFDHFVLRWAHSHWSRRNQNWELTDS